MGERDRRSKIVIQDKFVQSAPPLKADRECIDLIAQEYEDQDPEVRDSLAKLEGRSASLSTRQGCYYDWFMAGVEVCLYDKPMVQTYSRRGNPSERF